MRDRPIQLRPNWYPDGPYLDSVCIHCTLPLRHTGASGGVTWSPIPTPTDSTWSTCWSNEVEHGAYGGHEPWEAIPMGPLKEPA